jgi:hypothetical protein
VADIVFTCLYDGETRSATPRILGHAIALDA